MSAVEEEKRVLLNEVSVPKSSESDISELHKEKKSPVHYPPKYCTGPGKHLGSRAW
ncbi:hypothetical protein DVH05_008273 [Phytophthora capsici]|nr:hypothetical protein DVH05_008273 [Phytophthora capsici]